MINDYSVSDLQQLKNPKIENSSILPNFIFINTKSPLRKDLITIKIHFSFTANYSLKLKYINIKLGNITIENVALIKNGIFIITIPYSTLYKSLASGNSFLKLSYSTGLSEYFDASAGLNLSFEKNTFILIDESHVMLNSAALNLNNNQSLYLKKSNENRLESCQHEIKNSLYKCKISSQLVNSNAQYDYEIYHYEKESYDLMMIFFDIEYYQKKNNANFLVRGIIEPIFQNNIGASVLPNNILDKYNYLNFTQFNYSEIIQNNSKNVTNEKKENLNHTIYISKILLENNTNNNLEDFLTSIRIGTDKTIIDCSKEQGGSIDVKIIFSHGGKYNLDIFSALSQYFKAFEIKINLINIVYDNLSIAINTHKYVEPITDNTLIYEFNREDVCKHDMKLFKIQVQLLFKQFFINLETKVDIVVINNRNSLYQIKELYIGDKYIALSSTNNLLNTIMAKFNFFVSVKLIRQDDSILVAFEKNRYHVYNNNTVILVDNLDQYYSNDAHAIHMTLSYDSFHLTYVIKNEDSRNFHNFFGEKYRISLNLSFMIASKILKPSQEAENLPTEKYEIFSQNIFKINQGYSDQNKVLYRTLPYIKNLHHNSNIRYINANYINIYPPFSYYEKLTILIYFMSNFSLQIFR